MIQAEHLKRDGLCVLSGAFDAETVRNVRARIVANLDRMANTRPNPSSRHLAGFHRFAAFEPLHQLITTNAALTKALAAALAPYEVISIGLSDITVNRSQPWHTDLLRGRYARFLTPKMCWGPEGGRCLKALVYLQDRTSLKVLPGSHLRPVPLSDDVACIPDDKQDVLLVDVRVGDVVLTDIRLVHRGATEEETLASGVDQEPKILLSTVFGALGAPLTSAMQLGNAHRMVDWDASHLVHTAGPERRPLRVV